ncbi:MAG TPA: hypothetical protein PKG60_14665 [Spirochaetota bacterium]|nr:hypothetical protein [Spirochaetota bacterium]HPS88232.1 hypothetical protein [Spirochaetota bacterium]
MTNFELIQDLVKRVEEIESDLKYLRDSSEPLTSEAIDSSLSVIKELYRKLQNIDQALEDEKTGYILF